MKTKIQELETTLLDQIEKLNDDTVLEDPEKAKTLCERSKCIADLTEAYIGVNRMKLDVVKELNRNGGLYEDYLGLENAGQQKTKKLGRHNV